MKDEDILKLVKSDAWMMRIVRTVKTLNLPEKWLEIWPKLKITD